MVVDLDRVLIVSAFVILVGAFFAFVLVVLHGWAVRIERNRYDRFAGSMRARVIHASRNEEEEDLEQVVHGLVRGRLRDRARLLRSVGGMLAGGDKVRITRLARECGVLDLAARSMADRRWWRRLYGLRIVTCVGGNDSLVPPLLADPHPLVRSEAAHWCGQHPTRKNVRRLLNLMDTPTLADRIAVIDALVAMGPIAVQPLVERMKDFSTQGRKAGLTAALGLADTALLPAALECTFDGDEGVRFRAARLLSVLGSKQAIERLSGLLDDPSHRMRATAARGLGRLGVWSKAGALERLLSDPHRHPQRDAAIALSDLGPPGWVLLREAARAGGPAGRLAEAALEALHSPDDPGWSLAVHKGAVA